MIDDRVGPSASYAHNFHLKQNSKMLHMFNEDPSVKAADLLLQPLVTIDSHFNGTVNSDGLPSLSRLSCIMSSKHMGTQYLYCEGILCRPVMCFKCMKLSVGYKKDPHLAAVQYEKGIIKKPPSALKECFTYRCKDRSCSWQQSVFANTFFEKAKKQPHEVMMVLYLWLSQGPIKHVRRLTGWSEKAVIEYYAKFRHLVSVAITEYMLDNDDAHMVTFDSVQLGGPGVEVQIDESAFDKRKYHRGHSVETKWVFGGVEITPTADGKKKGGRFFSVVVPNRTRETLQRVIKQFIKPGTKIVSDGWAAYKDLDKIPDYSYQHEVVNHSKRFKNHDTGAHTNTIEGKWCKLKRSIPRQGFREDGVLQGYLGEQMWRHTNKGHLWEAAMSALKDYMKREL